MKRSLITALVVGSMLVSAGANGQVVTHTYNTQHSFTLTPSAGSTWTGVEVGYFLHAWVRFTPAAGGGGSASFRPGGSPGDLPLQPAGFAPFGYDDIHLGLPRNVCPWGLCNPPRSVMANMKTVSSTPAGVPQTNVLVSVPAVARADANATYRVNPWGPGTPVGGLIRSHGFWQEVAAAGAYSRAFSFTQVKATSTVPPPPPPGGPPTAVSRIVWSPVLLLTAFRASPLLPAPPVVAPPVRVYDPVKYVATDLIDGESVEGTAFSMTADVLDGTLNLEEGVLTVDASDAVFEVLMDDERVPERGTVRLVVMGGVVVESVATGVFGASQVPVGLPVPISMPFPADVAITIDLDGFGTGPRQIEITMDGGGASPSGFRDACGPADVGSQGGAFGSDGLLNNNDFVVFVDAFFNGLELADRGVQGGVEGSDGSFDNNDFIVFIDQFFRGCV